MPQLGFVLLSGGMDSTTCLFKAIADCGSNNVTAISIDYGQRHSTEIDHAKEICELRGIKHRVIHLEEQPPSMLTSNEEIPDIHYEDIKGVSPTYVWNRNMQLISRITAIAHALTQMEMEKVARHNEGARQPMEPVVLPSLVYAGMHAEDAANFAYPDCTPEFVGAMAAAVSVATYYQVRLIAPLLHLSKADVVTMGEALEVPWELTWSCYAGGSMHCGQCPTCYARQAAFNSAMVDDPTHYATSRFPSDIDDDEIPF